MSIMVPLFLLQEREKLDLEFFTFSYFCHWLFWNGFRLGISNMIEFLYMCIFKTNIYDICYLIIISYPPEDVCQILVLNWGKNRYPLY